MGGATTGATSEFGCHHPPVPTGCQLPHQHSGGDVDRLHRETILHLRGGEERDHELHLGLPAHPLPRSGEGRGALLWESWRAPTLGSRGGDGDGAVGARAGGSPVMWPSCTVSTSPTCRGAWPPSAAAVPPSPPGPAPRVPLAVLWTPARAPASPARLAPTCGVTPPTRHPPATPAALAHAATR